MRGPGRSRAADRHATQPVRSWNRRSSSRDANCPVRLQLPTPHRPPPTCLLPTADCLLCLTPRTGRRHIQYGPFDGPSEVAQIEQADPDYHKVTPVIPCRNTPPENDLPPGRFDVTCRTPKKACSTFDTARVRGCISMTVRSRTLTRDRKQSVVGGSEAALSPARTFRSTSAMDARPGFAARGNEHGLPRLNKTPGANAGLPSGAVAGTADAGWVCVPHPARPAAELCRSMRSTRFGRPHRRARVASGRSRASQTARPQAELGRG